MSLLLVLWNMQPIQLQIQHSSNINETAMLMVTGLFLTLFPLLCREGVLNLEHCGGIVLEKSDAEALLLWASE